MSDAIEGGSVLVVDDDRPVVMGLIGFLKQAGHRPEYVGSADEALARVASRPVDVVITDLRMPSMDGMELLERLTERVPGLPVIMLTAHGSVQTAVEAMKKGAADFLTKPYDRDEVLYTVDKALRASRYVADQPEKPEPVGDVPWLGESDAMKETAQLIARAAKSPSTVLIRGESGSGKEVAARAIHAASDRADGPFVPVHCAALAETLLESELFGHEKGAFTGATHAQAPVASTMADGGTLFLDEVGDAARFERPGEAAAGAAGGGGASPWARTRPRSVDLRVVAATHRDARRRWCARGEFREDLFYRLNVIPARDVPPLRERRGDIPHARGALPRPRTRRRNERPDARGSRCPRRSSRLERSYGWPGNVRELSNFVERLIVFSDDDVVTLEDVERELARQPKRRASRPPAASPGDTLEDRRESAERDAIKEALARAGGTGRRRPACSGSAAGPSTTSSRRWTTSLRRGEPAHARDL